MLLEDGCSCSPTCIGFNPMRCNSHIWLNYCNSPFLSLTDFELRRLQLVQNSLCRVVTHSAKSSHITPELKKTSLATSQIQGTT